MGAVEIESIPETPENEEYLASLGLTSSVKDDDLPNGTKYTILAYKKTGNSYTFDKKQTFTVGQNSEIKLDHGQNYTLILISNGTSTSPNIYNEKDINNANILNNDENPKVLYQRIDNFIPNGNINNKINVKLRHKDVSIRIIIDSSDILGGNMGRNITHIGNPRIDCTVFHRFGLDRGEAVPGEDDIVGYYKEVNNFGSLGRLVISSDYNYCPVIENRDYIMFSTSYYTEGAMSGQRVRFMFKNIKSGYRYTFRIKLKRCGAYLGENKTNWRQFMCHNLGADYTKDPFIPSADIHGDKYQWGYSYPIIKQKDDVYNTVGIPNWNRVRKDNTWNKGMDDPCPSGYRVPTGDDILPFGFIASRSVGDKGANTRKLANGGLWVGSSLMLPTAGRLDAFGSASTGMTRPTAIYWATDGPSDIPIEKGVYGDYRIKGDRENGGEREEEYTEYNNARDSLYGLPVRCVKKKR